MNANAMPALVRGINRTLRFADGRRSWNERSSARWEQTESAVETHFPPRPALSCPELPQNCPEIQVVKAPNGPTNHTRWGPTCMFETWIWSFFQISKKYSTSTLTRLQHPQQSNLTQVTATQTDNSTLWISNYIYGRIILIRTAEKSQSRSLADRKKTRQDEL